MSNSKIVMILGMHRSGTSLLANWLHHCGLNLGEEYISLKAGNEKGHFEDLEMYNLHRNILKANGTDYLVHNKQKLIVSEQYFQQAKRIVEKRNNTYDLWGWKEPRTCLFLDKWHELVPDAKVIITFRHYNEVIDSLARRQVIAEKIRTNKLLGYYNVFTQKKYWKPDNLSKLLNTWIHYNSAILKYLNQKASDDYIVINVDNLQSETESIIDEMNTNWRMSLKNYPFEEIFSKKMMKKEVNKYDLNDEIIDKADKVFKSLIKKQRRSYVE